jgi:hypothetical protein
MRLRYPIVFVLGAGFSRAFDSDAPLARCDIGIDGLIARYEHHHPAIRSVLESTRVGLDGDVDVEMLLTRLHLGMPHDGAHLPEYYRNALYEEVSASFFCKLKQIEPDEDSQMELMRFAAIVADASMTCITFNNDTLQLREPIYWLRRPRVNGPQEVREVVPLHEIARRHVSTHG